MKEKEEEEKLLIEEHLCINACHTCYWNLISEESKTIQKETNDITENLKAQVIKEKEMHNELVENHDELVDREKETN